MLTRYFQFKDWADNRTIEAVQKLNTTSEHYAFARQQLNHIVIVEELFKARLLGQADPYDNTNTSSVPRLDVLAEQKNQLNKWFISYTEASDQEQLAQEIHFIFKDGNPGMMVVHEILLHLLTHGSYHRGNIACALDQAGIPHPVDGYGIYIHQAEEHRRTLI